MLQLTPQNVGTAPGTTTLMLPRAEVTRNGRSLNGALGTIYPTDFDLSKMYGYLPYNSGWISGKLVEEANAMALGEEAASQLSPDQQVMVMQAKMAALEVAAKEEEVKSSRSMRTWTIVAGLVGVAGLGVSIYALKKGR